MIIRCSGGPAELCDILSCCCTQAVQDTYMYNARTDTHNMYKQCV